MEDVIRIDPALFTPHKTTKDLLAYVRTITSAERMQCLSFFCSSERKVRFASTVASTKQLEQRNSTRYSLPLM